jgi:hypothetical protein
MSNVRCLSLNRPTLTTGVQDASDVFIAYLAIRIDITHPRLSRRNWRELAFINPDPMPFNFHRNLPVRLTPNNLDRFGNTILMTAAVRPDGEHFNFRLTVLTRNIMFTTSCASLC